MAHIVLNVVLWYLACARNNTPKDVIIKSAVSFYDEDATNRAMDDFFKLHNEKNIARKSCPSLPNVNVKHADDILNLFSKKDDNPFVLQLLLQKDLFLCRLLGLTLLHPC